MGNFDELFISNPENEVIFKSITLPPNLLYAISDKCFEIRYNSGMVDEHGINSIYSSSPSGKGPKDNNNEFNRFNLPKKPVRNVPVRQDTLSTVGMTNTYYIYSYDGKLMAEYDHTGNVTKNYIYLGDRLLAEYDHQRGGYQYYMSDTHRSTRIVTDSTGTVVYSAV